MQLLNRQVPFQLLGLKFQFLSPNLYILEYVKDIKIQTKRKKSPYRRCAIARPTLSHFLELQKPSHDAPELHTFSRPPDIEALKL